ncbi:P-loop containing nucleoside triphosphate hydrolase protein [Apiospora arundinis]
MSKAPSTTPSKATSQVPSKAPSRAPSRTPSQAPSQAPSKAPSRALSQSPSSLAETSAPPRAPNYQKPSVATIVEDAVSIDASPNPTTFVPASRGLHVKTSAASTANAATPSRVESWVAATSSALRASHAPTQSSSSRAGTAYAPSLAPGWPTSRTMPASAIARSRAPTAAAANTRGSFAGVPVVPPTPSSSSSMATVVPVGVGTDVDDTAAPATIISTAAGVPIASKWTSTADIEAATRQVNYEMLGAEERRMQDKWAKKKADEFAPCPMNFAWMRHETLSDLMLAQGEPGLYSTVLPWGSDPAQYMPPWNEGQIPYPYYGPIKPLGWDDRGKQWIYPDMC